MGCAKHRWVAGTMVMVLAVCLVSGPGDGALGQETGRGAKSDKSFEYAWPELKPFEDYFGVWKITEHHFDRRGKLVGKVEAAEEIAWMLERRAVRRTYTRSEGNPAYRAVGFLTWNDVLKRYDGVWFDNASSAGPTTVTGTWDEETRTMTFAMVSTAPSGATVRHKVVDRFNDDNHRTATTYLLERDKEIKLMEVKYKRTRACPAKVQRIFDG